MTDVEFVAAGSPRLLSRAIEEYAEQQRMVNAIVVPWQSDPATLSMSVTAARGEGWEIEHLDLGTIRLTDLGNNRTRVVCASSDPNQSDESKAPLFESFARQIQRRLQAGPT